MKNKTLFFIFSFLFILSLFGFIKNRFENNFIYLYGEKQKVEDVAYMYWYPEDSLENVSYYKFKKETILYCKQEIGNYMLCAWKFSLFQEPLFGWIKMEKLKNE
jgi:hypothetical protein